MKIWDMNISSEAKRALRENECYDIDENKIISDDELRELLPIDESYIQEIYQALQEYFDVKREREHELFYPPNFMDSKGGYYYVNLTDETAEIITEPSWGYFELLAEMCKDENFITYSSLLENPRRYLQKPVDFVLCTLPEREQMVITKRFGINIGKKKTYKEIGDETGCSGETIRLVEKTALRKLCHPFKKRKLQNAWLSFDEYECGIQRNWNYSLRFEELINEDIKYYRDMLKIDSNILFKNVLRSCRFKVSRPEGDMVKSLEEYGLSKSICDCLKSIGVNTNIDLEKMEIGDLKKVNGLDVVDTMRIKTLRTKLWLERSRDSNAYELDGDSIFDIEGEIPITRTLIPPMMMFKLLEKGFFYVGDFLEAIDCFVEDINGEEPNLLLDFPKEIEILKYYSQPMVRVKISKRIQHAMKSRGIDTYEKLLKNRENFSENMKDELNEIIGIVTCATEKMRNYRQSIQVEYRKYMPSPMEPYFKKIK